MPLLQSLQTHWDQVTGRWSVTHLLDARERAEAAAVLHAVPDEEPPGADGADPWAPPVVGGRPVPTQLFGVRDRRDGRMVGALQVAEAAQVLGQPDVVATFALDRIGPELARQTLLVRVFALLPELRRSPAGLALLAEGCRYGRALGHSMVAFAAAPGQLARHLQLGARPLAPLRSTAGGGYRIPLVLLFADRQHLDAVNSPLRLLVRADDFPADHPSLHWQRDFERMYGHIDTGVSPYDPALDDVEAPVHALLSRGMNDAGVRALLEGSLSLGARVGDRIVAQGAGGAQLGVVAAGLVHVVIDGQVVAAIGPGELFGEIAFATGAPRSADLVAASPGTQLLQFSPAALEALPPDAALCLWRNLARCLGQRLVERTSGRH